MESQFQNPVRIVAFNTAEGWARDVTVEIAQAIRDNADRSATELLPGHRDFVDRELDRANRLTNADPIKFLLDL